jgi:hypothetical protein
MWFGDEFHREYGILATSARGNVGQVRESKVSSESLRFDKAASSFLNRFDVAAGCSIPSFVSSSTKPTVRNPRPGPLWGKQKIASEKGI